MTINEYLCGISDALKAKETTLSFRPHKLCFAHRPAYTQRRKWYLLVTHGLSVYFIVPKPIKRHNFP